MTTRTMPQSVLLILLVACIVTTTFHYADNAISFHKYPDGGGVTAEIVVLAWALLTPIGVLGYRLYRSGRFVPAYAALAVYSFLGVSTPVHYTEANFADFALWRNVSILTDGVMGVAIVGFVLWSALVAREWAQQRAAAWSR